MAIKENRVLSTFRGFFRKAFLVKEIISRTGEVHFRRWRVLQTPLCAIYVHNIRRSDEEKDPHDHPWWFASLILRGGYKERVWRPEETAEHVREPGSLFWHPTNVFHKITLLGDEAWTLVVTGPRTHDLWGYRTSEGWVNHVRYRARKNASSN